MKFLLYTCILFLFSNSLLAQFIFDFQSSSLSEEILDNEFYIKEHLLGNDVAKKVKMLDLSYKWIDPPSSIRIYSKVQIEKKIIYFSVKKIISPKYYKEKLKIGDINIEDAREEIITIINIALMIRYQDTDELEAYLRRKETSEIRDIFLKKIITK